MNKTTTYYQPFVYCDDGKNISWDLAEDFMSFWAFRKKEDAEDYMENVYGLSACEINVVEFHDEDIEGVTILDKYGNAIEINE